jgi:hypothetical protein
MSSLLREVIPLALAAAISPAIFLLQLNTLTGDRPIARGAALTAGVVGDRPRIGPCAPAPHCLAICLVSLCKSQSAASSSSWGDSGSSGGPERCHHSGCREIGPPSPLGFKLRDDNSPHPCRTYGVARPAQRLVSMALGRRSLIRMRAEVQVLPGPQNRPVSRENARRSWLGRRLARMYPLRMRSAPRSLAVRWQPP